MGCMITEPTAAKPVVVIGAGIAGLSAATNLNRRGHEIQVIEKSAHRGGRMETEGHHGSRFETGMQFYYSAYSKTNSLLTDVGLRSQLLAAPVRGYMAWNGRVAPFDKNKPWLSLLSARENLGLWRAMGRHLPYLLGLNIFDY